METAGCRGGGEAHTDAWRPASGRRGHSPVRRLHITRRARPLVGRPPPQRPGHADPGAPARRSVGARRTHRNLQHRHRAHPGLLPVHRRNTGSCALDTLRIGDVELAGADGAAIPRGIRGGTLALGRVARSEHHVVSAARQLATHFEPDPAVRTGDERHRGSLSPARFPSPPYRSVHTASSLPLGSVKWNRRPPGKENVGFTIFPPASLTFASTSSSRVA